MISRHMEVHIWITDATAHLLHYIQKTLFKKLLKSFEHIPTPLPLSKAQTCEYAWTCELERTSSGSYVI